MTKTYSLDETTIRGAVLDRMEALGVTPRDLASKSGLDLAPSTIYRYIAGDFDPKSSTAESIMRLLGIRLSVAPGRPSWVAEARR